VAAPQASPQEAARVTVLVEDQSGAAITNASLSFASSNMKQGVEAVNGVVKVELRPGSYVMTASSRCFVTGTKYLTIVGKGVQSFEIKLQTDSICSGYSGPVVDNPFAQLQLWTPSLDDVWLPVESFEFPPLNASSRRAP
jgi:hypothetical protein